MKQNLDREHLRSALLSYLLVFGALNLYAWGSFLLHGHNLRAFPLGNTVERFGDLLRFSGKYQIGKDPKMLDTEHLIGTLFPANYPPFAVMIYLFLLQVCSPYALFVMLGAVLGGVGVACTLLWLRVRRFEAYRWYMGVAIFATGLFGWATEQVVMRANIEGIVWIGVCLGAALYARRRFCGAAIAFAIACCIKPFPLLWLGLMARHRKYREVALGLASAFGTSLLSLLVIDPNPLRAYRRISGKSAFFSDYVVGFRLITGDHSLFQVMKMLGHMQADQSHLMDRVFRPNDPLAVKLYPIYLLLAAAIGLATLWRVWDMPMLNQIFALACVTTVLPAFAGDYTLIVLLIPMGFFLIFLLQDVATGRAPLSRREMLWFLLPCAWIMATEPPLVIHGVLKCFACLVLLGASLTIPLPSTVFGEVSPDN